MDSKIKFYENKLGMSLEEYLLKMYVTEKLSLDEIVEVSGIPKSSLASYFRKYNIPYVSLTERYEHRRKIISTKKCSYCGECIPKYREHKDTCCDVCARKWGYIDRHNQNNTIDHYCEYCGGKVPYERKSKRFCSSSCSVLYGHAKQGHLRVSLQCKVCGKSFTRKKSLINERCYCSSKCMYKDITQDVSDSDIYNLVLYYYETYKVTLTKELIAEELMTTTRVIEDRIGTMTTMYKKLNISYVPTYSTGKTANILFKMIDTIYRLSSEREKSFDDLRNPATHRKLRFDCFITNKNLAIEYQGKQHYEIGVAGVYESLEDIQYRDSIKREYCKWKDINLIEWKYTWSITESNIHRKLDKFLLRTPITQPMVPALTNTK